MKPTAQIMTELKRLVCELGLLNRNCLNSGMTFSQTHILSYVRKNGTTPFTELQLQLGLDKASLSRTVRALCERKYLCIVKDNTDRRAKLVKILPPGTKAMITAEESAKSRVDELLSYCDDQALTELYDALRHSRFSALRKNLTSNPRRIGVEPLQPEYFDPTMELLIKTFSVEQNIPENLVPIPPSKDPKWWCVRVGEDVLGAAAAWQDSGQWHWGRFAVDKNFRSLGIGKIMAFESITALFSGVTDKIVIEARDIAVGIIKKLGGEQTGAPFDFFGDPVTPMKLQKEDFLRTAKIWKNDGGTGSIP